MLPVTFNVRQAGCCMTAARIIAGKLLKEGKSPVVVEGWIRGRASGKVPEQPHCVHRHLTAWGSGGATPANLFVQHTPATLPNRYTHCMPIQHPTFTRVLRLRLKDKHARALRERAYWVNQVWNYCNDLSVKVLRREGRFLSGFDLQKYTNGCTKEGVPLHSQTVQAIAEEYATRRKQFKRGVCCIAVRQGR